MQNCQTRWAAFR